MTESSYPAFAGKLCRNRQVRTLVALATIALGSAQARADNIDEGLLKASGEIMAQLQAKGYKNVGVLKFQVQRGQEEPGFHTGRLSTLMATRLENALILADPLDNPIGITRGASQAAAEKDQGATYRTAEGRKALFQHNYPLAWGSKAVKVNAFLTGLVQVHPDKKQTTVTVQAFDDSDPSLRELAKFTVKIDRSVLADLNQRFLSKRAALGKQLLPDEEVVEEVIDDALVQTRAEAPKGPGIDEVLTFTLFYDNQPVARGADNKVPQPKPGQAVHFLLQAKQKLGLVLRVNGVNTLGKDAAPKEVDRAAKWVLEADKEYVIRGFYTRDAEGKTTVEPFRVVAPREVDRAELADESRLGQIDLDLFTEGTADSGPEKTIQVVSLKALPGAADSLRELRGEIRKAAASLRDKGIIIRGPGEGDRELDRVPFRGTWAGHLTITYFEPAAGANKD